VDAGGWEMGNGRGGAVSVPPDVPAGASARPARSAAANNLHQALYVARRTVGGASSGLFRLRDDGELLDRSLAIRRRLGDRRGVGLTVVNQGLVAAAAGDLGQADRPLREAFLLFEEAEDGPGRWGALADLGQVLFDAGEHQRARRRDRAGLPGRQR
jgi:hypothetical protein